MINYAPLQSLRFAEFSLLLEATEELHLPEYKGSTFRGGFGNALKKAVCMTKTFDCLPCILQQTCPYISIFEPKVSKATADLLRTGRDAPSPFVLEPPLTEQREFKVGDQFTVKLILIGNAIGQLPYFIYAFTLLGERIGLGTAKGKFTLLQATDSDGKKMYEHRAQTVKDSFRIFRSGEFLNGSSSARLTFKFTTPTRIMTSHGNGSRHLMRLREADDFWTFVESLHHRLFALSSLHCGAESADYREHKLPLHSHPVSLVESSIRWHDWERRSNRQGTIMKLGGFVGEATFEGEFAALLPLLRIGEHLHVGKNTSFGLGKYELQ